MSTQWRQYGVYEVTHTYQLPPPPRYEFLAKTLTHASTIGLRWIADNKVIYTTYEIREIS